MILLIVDAQKLIVNDALYKFDTFVFNVQSLLARARHNNIEVIYVRHDDGKDQNLTKGKIGYDIDDRFAPRADEKIFDKHVNSIFKDTGLLEYLKSKNEKQLIIAGLQSDYCIDASVKCGFEHGFQMIIPAYANTTIANQFMTAKDSYQYYNEFIWPKRYATCLSLEETLKIMNITHP